MSILVPFLLFAFVAAITPGPTNILVLSFSARYGLTATLPIVFAACAAAAGVVFVVGLGLGVWIDGHAWLGMTMSWAGILWLSWLAWQLFRSEAIAPTSPTSTRRDLTPWRAAGLQLINPKVWMMALAVVGVFAAPGTRFHDRVWILALAFFIVALPSMSMWALLGQRVASVLRSPRWQRRFSQLMAIMLLASAWATVIL